jgi:hypothetical protein
MFRNDTGARSSTEEEHRIVIWITSVVVIVSGGLLLIQWAANDPGDLNVDPHTRWESRNGDQDKT